MLGSTVTSREEMNNIDSTNMKNFLVMVACAVALAACTTKEEVEPQTSQYVRFYPLMTRATETQFEQGDQISISAVHPTAGTELKTSGNYADNIPYVFSGGMFVPEKEDGIKLPLGEESGLAYYAVYPQQDALATEGTFTVQQDQREHKNRTLSDFCTVFVPTTGNKDVYLKFWHRMSRICVDLTGITIQPVTMQLKNMSLEVAFDLNANTYASTGGGVSDVYMSMESNKRFEAILPPQEFNITTDIIVNIDGRDYNVTSTRSADVFRTGMEYDYTLIYVEGEIRLVGEPVEVAIDGEIYPWNTVSTQLEEVVTIEESKYQDASFPAATADYVLYDVTYNSNAIQGGSNIFTIVTDKTFKRFYIGIKGYYGCLACAPESITSGGLNTYFVTVIYSPEYKYDMTMLICGEDENGYITKPFEAEVTFVDSKYESGELNVNLTFSNAKDLDLHLYMPNGEHIFYGERGGTVQTEDGKTVSYGLDHDSNAGCDTDNLNNENIYIPAELIQTGLYRVVIDMYTNCAPKATSWSVVARYKNQYLVATNGRNPASGVYPDGAGNGDNTTVMEFVIDNGGTSFAPARIRANTFVPTPLSDMDEMKLEEEKFRLEHNQ